MDDINRKLEEILNDADSMDKVRQMAQSILGEEGGNASGPEIKENPLDSAEIGRIMKIISRLEAGNDNRTKLLLALKPNLTGKRREKVDSAIKLLKLIEALPLLREAGILDLG